MELSIASGWDNNDRVAAASEVFRLVTGVPLDVEVRIGAGVDLAGLGVGIFSSEGTVERPGCARCHQRDQAGNGRRVNVRESCGHTWWLSSILETVDKRGRARALLFDPRCLPDITKSRRT